MKVLYRRIFDFFKLNWRKGECVGGFLRGVQFLEGAFLGGEHLCTTFGILFYSEKGFRVVNILLRVGEVFFRASNFRLRFYEGDEDSCRFLFQSFSFP